MYNRVYAVSDIIFLSISDVCVVSRFLCPLIFNIHNFHTVSRSIFESLVKIIPDQVTLDFIHTFCLTN